MLLDCLPDRHGDLLVFLFTVCPRPVYFSMMRFTAELTLILEANRSGRIQPLYWLPLIFLVWADLHIQFIYGLAVLGLQAGLNLAHKLAAHAGWDSQNVSAPSPVRPGTARQTSSRVASASCCCRRRINKRHAFRRCGGSLPLEQ
jgi:hypothetical protein